VAKGKPRNATDHWTQQQFAALLGSDQAVVNRLLARGILTRGAPWFQWVREIYQHYANDAAGRSGEKLNLADERARLAQAQTTRILFELAKERGEFVSLDQIVGAQIYTNTVIRTKLLSLPQRIHSIHQELSKKVYASLDQIIRELLNELASTRFPPEVSARLDALNDEAFQRATENPPATDAGGRAAVSEENGPGDNARSS
jgi:phage terminase Nu1 subunit (DNA packaging protein)